MFIKKDILEWWRYSWTFSCEKMSGTCDELSTLKHPKRVAPHKELDILLNIMVFILFYKIFCQLDRPLPRRPLSIFSGPSSFRLPSFHVVHLYGSVRPYGPVQKQVSLPNILISYELKQLSQCYMPRYARGNLSVRIVVKIEFTFWLYLGL